MVLASGANVDNLQPLQLPWQLRLTPEQFEQVCRNNPDAVLELSADGQLIPMTPTGSETGARCSALNLALALAIRRCGLPLKLFDSSTGFRLPDGSVFSPDASALHLDRWQALTADERRSFAPLCPDLVVELASPSDQGPRGLNALRQKMELYRSNGAQLGVLLQPDQCAADLWLADGTIQHLEPVHHLAFGPPFQGLVLDLAEVWAA